MVADGFAAGRLGRAAVIAQRTAATGWIRWMLRFLLSGVFAYAGALKMRVSHFLGVVISGKIIKHVLVAMVGAGSWEIFQRWLGY